MQFSTAEMLRMSDGVSSRRRRPILGQRPMKRIKGETTMWSERQAFDGRGKRQHKRGIGATVVMHARAVVNAIEAIPRKQSHERSGAVRKRPCRDYLARLFIFAIAIAIAAAYATSAEAETCIQGVHDCIKTQTTDEGGFDPKNPWFQKNPTLESTIEFLQYFSMPCLPIPVGDRTSSPPPTFRTYLDNLQSAGIISYRLHAPASGDPGEIGVDVRLSPTIGPEHFKPGAGTCLKQGVFTDIAITGWERKDILNYKGVKVPVIIAYGTAENTEYDSVFLQYLKAKGEPPPIAHEKFRLLYVYEDRHSAWRMVVTDAAEVGELDFRTNHINEYLQRM